MKDEFEKRLKDRITQVFDDYGDNSADAGWALLREKYPEKKRRGVIWLWMSSAAALLLLFLGIGIWDGSKKTKPTQIVTNIQRIDKRSGDTAKLPGNQTRITKISSKVDSAVQPLIKSQRVQRIALPSVHQNIAAVASGKRGLSTTGNNQSNAAQQPPAIAIQSVKPEPTVSQQQNVAVANSAVTNNILVDTSAKRNIAQNEAKPISPVVKSPFTENDPVVKKNKTVKQDVKAQTVSFGLYAATYVSYASGSSNQVNLGAGLASDIHLAKNLKLSTGVAVNQNTLSYGGHLPPSTGIVATAAAAINIQAFSKPSTFSSSVAYAPPTLQNYNAQLTSLDVPLNLKYEFNPQKNSSFVSLGVSSGTFINETYNSQYGYNNSQQTLNSSNNFSGFYFAKTLDFSFGLGYPVGKNNLSVEPFVKYPLQGLGADQIRFGAGGLNLKFNFSNTKK